MDIPYGNKSSKIKTKKIRDWFINVIGVKKSEIDMNNKSIYIELERYSISQLKDSKEYAFSNHLQIVLERDPQLLSWRINNKTKLPNTHGPKSKKPIQKNSSACVV